MRFTRLELRDFMSYQAQELDLGSLDYAAIAGANGSGKSSIGLGVAFALFGTARVRGDSDSVVRDGADECVVTLEFTADRSVWRIERSKKRGKSAKVRLFSQDSEGDWHPYGDHLNNTAQVRIEELAGLTEDAFYSLTMIDGQAGARFIKADSTQRREILLSLLPEMAVWADMDKRAREMLTEARQRTEADRAKIEADEERIRLETERITGLEAEVEANNAAELKAQVSDLDADIAAVQKRIDADAVSIKTAELKALEGQNASRTAELVAVLNHAKAEARSRADEARALKDAQSDVDRAEESVVIVETRLESATADLAEAEADMHVVCADGNREELAQQESALSARLSEVNAASALTAKTLAPLQGLQESHAATCPTCQSDLDAAAIGELVAQLTTSLDRDKALAKEIAARRAEVLDALSATDERVARARAAVEAKNARVREVTAQLSSAKESLQSAHARLERTLNAANAASVTDAEELHAQALDVMGLRERDLDAARVESERREAQLRSEIDDLLTEGAGARDRQTLQELRVAKRDLLASIENADRAVGRLDAARSTLKELTQSMRDRVNAIKDADVRIAALDMVVQACRPQGVPSMLLDGVLAPIEAEATRLLNEVPGGEGMALRFEQSRALKSKVGAKEVLDIMVTLPSGTERPIESLSAGETVRVSLALIFAMITVLGARHGGDALDTVFLDEPLGPLDQEAVPAFVQVLRGTLSAGALSSVLVVTHDQRVIDALPQRILVERTPLGDSNATVVG